MKTRLSEHGIDAAAAAAEIERRFTARGSRCGEKNEVDGMLAGRIVASRG